MTLRTMPASHIVAGVLPLMSCFRFHRPYSHVMTGMLSMMVSYFGFHIHADHLLNGILETVFTAEHMDNNGALQTSL